MHGGTQPFLIDRLGRLDLLCGKLQVDDSLRHFARLVRVEVGVDRSALVSNLSVLFCRI